MSIKALTFDTGGALVDWHSGFREALESAGRKHGINRDWAAMANELRRRSLGAMLNLGEKGQPEYNFDGAHRFTLDAILSEQGLHEFDEADRHAIAYRAPHSFSCWPDCPGGLAKIRKRFIAASFTILSYRLIIDTAKANGLVWDAVLSCEGYGIYKLLPAAYEKTAHYLQLDPSQCCMVACHSFDLDAAKSVGFKTALVHRPLEWGGQETQVGTPPDPANYDYVADDFLELANMLPDP